MTSTLHLLLLLSLHGPTASAGLFDSVVERAYETGSSELGEGPLLAEEEIEEHEDDRVAGAFVALDTTALAAVVAAPCRLLEPVLTRGDAVSRHFARGPPAA